MKTTLTLILGLMSASVFAGETLTAEKMADLLSSSKVAPCLAKLYALQADSEIHANGYGFEVVKDEAQRLIHTTIGYRVVKGGDMIAGDAKIIVTEKLYQVMEAPEGVTAPKVESCQFDAQIDF